MNDLELTRDSSGELMLFQIEGITTAGVDFLDAYMPQHDYFVVDSGRIILHEDAEADFLNAAREHGLSWEVVS